MINPIVVEIPLQTNKNGDELDKKKTKKAKKMNSFQKLSGKVHLLQHFFPSVQKHLFYSIFSVAVIST